MALVGPLSTPEVIIILAVLLLVFGAKRLPEMGRSLGRGMREFKDAVTGEEKETSTAPELPASSETEHTHDDAPAEKPERETVP